MIKNSTKVNRINNVRSKLPFTTIRNEAIKNKNLSWKAKGILVFLISLPEDWKIYISELQTHAKDGRDATNKGIDELIKAGYVVRNRIHNSENGRFEGYEYDVSDEVQTICRKPVNGKPVNGKTVNGKPVTIKERSNKRKIKQKKEVKQQITKSDNLEDLFIEATIQEKTIKSSFDVKDEILNQNILTDSPEARIKVWKIYEKWIEHESFASLWSFYGDMYKEVDPVELMKIWVTKADWYTVTQVKVNLVQGWIKRANQEIQKLKSSTNGKTRNNKNLISESDAKAVFNDLMQNGI